MTEASKDKTKRKYTHLMMSYPWSYQCSIFYVSPEQSIQLLNDMRAFKQRLRRKCPDLPFLIRICLNHTSDNELQAFLTLYTVKSVKDTVTALANTTFPTSVNVLGQIRQPGTIESTSNTIKREKPHNLTRFFGKKKVNRYSVLNEHLIEQHHQTTA